MSPMRQSVSILTWNSRGNERRFALGVGSEWQNDEGGSSRLQQGRA